MTRDLLEPLLVLALVVAVLAAGCWLQGALTSRRAPTVRHPRSAPLADLDRRLLLERCREMDAAIPATSLPNP